MSQPDSLLPAPSIAEPAQRPHLGMPPFDQGGKPLSFFEFWPMWAFYPPVLLYAFWLMLRYRGILLPTVANPKFPGGGLVGESKAEILKLAIQHIPQWVAPFVCLEGQPDSAAGGIASQTQAAMDALALAGQVLPVVAKPDLGCRGVGVKLVRTVDQLASYIQSFPAGGRYLLQRYVPHEGEAGIFYCRMPGQARGRIISITLKYFPYIYGDGRSSVRQLIEADPRASQIAHLYLRRHSARLDEVLPAGQPMRLAFAGSHSRGAIFRNGTALVTPEMEARFDALSHSLPEFYFGRYDIRFEDFAAVQGGEAFTIVEVNGAGAESTHIWDRSTGLLRAWADLMLQYRLLFQIGRANRDRGFKPLTLAQFRSGWKREQELTALYPATD